QSYENDKEWKKQVQERVRNDARCNLVTVEGYMNRVVSHEALDNYDLVFIDDSKSVAERQATIQSVASYGIRYGLVLIHDFEREAYRKAARPFLNQFCFSALSPRTGLCWNDAQVDKDALRRLNRTIK